MTIEGTDGGIESISAVTLATQSMAKSVEFYRSLGFELASGGPQAEFTTLIEGFSPSQVADQIAVPVLAMHSTDDPLVPYAELIRLEAGMPQAEISTVQLFRHVDFDPASPSGWWSLTPDLWKVWHMTTWILAG